MATTTTNYSLHVHDKGEEGDSFSDFVDNNNADMQAIDTAMAALAARKSGSRGAYDAIVYKQDEEVIAEDASGDEIGVGTAGVNDAAVIQAVLDALAATGGSVLLCNGAYTAEDTIQMPSYTKLFGQNTRKTIITAKNSLNNDVISTSAASGEGANFCHCIEIVDLTVDGNKNNQTVGNCINLLNLKYGRVENCYIDHAKQDGLKIYGNAPGGLYTDLNNILFNRIYNPGRHCINMAGYAYGHRIIGNTLASAAYCGLAVTSAQECHFFQNNCHGNLVGIYFNYVTSSELVQNHSEDNRHQGLSITGSEGYPSQISVVGNTVRRNSTLSAGDYANVVLDYADHCTLTGNILYFDNVNKLHSYAIDEASTCSYTMLRGNQIDLAESNRLLGYNKFENWGSSTGTGSSQTIAHKLYASPTRVIITIPTRNYMGSCSFSATNIYPEVPANLAFNWYAAVEAV